MCQSIYHYIIYSSILYYSIIDNSIIYYSILYLLSSIILSSIILSSIIYYSIRLSFLIFASSTIRIILHSLTHSLVRSRVEECSYPKVSCFIFFFVNLFLKQTIPSKTPLPTYLPINLST